MNTKLGCLLTVAAGVQLLCLLSCAHTESSERSGRQVSYDQWITMTFTNIALDVELPVGATISRGREGLKWVVCISFHQAPPPLAALDDDTVHVRMTAERVRNEHLSIEEMERELRGRSEESQQFWRWYFEFHTQTARRDDGRVSYYRRDVRLTEEEIIHAHVEVLNVGPTEVQRADHAAVRRILDSMTPRMGSQGIGAHVSTGDK